MILAGLVRDTCTEEKWWNVDLKHHKRRHPQNWHLALASLHHSKLLEMCPFVIDIKIWCKQATVWQMASGNMTSSWKWNWHDNMIISRQLYDKIECSPPCRRGWSRQTLLQAGWYIHQEMKHCFQRDSLREVIEPFEIEVSMYGEAKRTELVDVSRCLYIQYSVQYGIEEFAVHSMVQGNLLDWIIA